MTRSKRKALATVRRRRRLKWSTNVDGEYVFSSELTSADVQVMPDFNFMNDRAPIEDFELIFGPLGPEETFATFDDDLEHMGHIMVRAGIFRSLGEASRNGGWSDDIPSGYSEHRVGKHKRVCIWNPDYSHQNDDLADEWAQTEEFRKKFPHLDGALDKL